MSASSIRNRDIDDALRTLATEYGVSVHFVPATGKGHRRVVFTRNDGVSRFNVLSGSPSSGGVLLAVCRQARRTLRDLSSISFHGGSCRGASALRAKPCSQRDAYHVRSERGRVTY
jgi:hypothetical protein